MTEKRFALIIATHQYTDTDLRQLVSPAHDAEALAQVLKDPVIGGFDVRTLLNKPSHEVRVEINTFFADRERDDLLLLYFSCHGIKDEDGMLYFSTTDTKRKLLPSTAIESNFVNKVMQRSRSRKQVLLLDCCYSGAFARGMLTRADTAIDTKERFDGKGLFVLTASDAMQYSFEGDHLEGKATPSVFTSSLVDGLKTGAADSDNDGDITPEELYEYVYKTVIDKKPEQRPLKWNFGVEGKIIIAHNPNPVVKPVELSKELLEVMNNPSPVARVGAVHELRDLLYGENKGLSLSALNSLKIMQNDDSRRVSVAATKILDEYEKAQSEMKAVPDAQRIIVDTGEERPHYIEATEEKPASVDDVHIEPQEQKSTGRKKEVEPTPQPPIKKEAMTQSQRKNVFISYSHTDKQWLERLKVHLKPLERKGVIDLWSDEKIHAGLKWKEEISKSLREAMVAVLLISADFLASDFIDKDELPPLLAAAEKEDTVILPVIVGHSSFMENESLSIYQAVNPPDKPLEGMTKVEQDAVFYNLYKSILSILKKRENKINDDIVTTDMQAYKGNNDKSMRAKEEKREQKKGTTQISSIPFTAYPNEYQYQNKKKQQISSKIIGIDLGTSNSAAAVLIGGIPTIIPSAEGATLGGKAFPSYVAFTKDGQKLVGEPARRQAVSNPEGTVYAIKRKMGTDYKVTIYGQTFTPQQISAFILQKIKQDAEAYLGERVEKAVITVPAYFNDNQRQATKDAGTIAGLDVVRIINEPTAASLAYGLDKVEESQKILVFDLGGGTLDCTIMDFGQGVFEVVSTSSDTQLGGTDMDNTIVDYLASEFKKEYGIDLKNDKMAMQRLREAAEKAKIELSTTSTTDINLPFLTADASCPKHFTHTLTRAKLEQLVSPIVNRCGHSVEQALKDAKLTPNDIHKVILVGGPTRMPIVQKFVEDYLGEKIEYGIDPMECVVVGAAIQAGVLSGEVKDLILLDVTPLSLGVETLGGVFTKLIEKNTTIPTKISQVFTTAEDNQTSIELHVLQGEGPMARDNITLGRFHLTGIPLAPKGIPQIEVTFYLDVNGIITVQAKDLGTGNEQKITITASTKLSQEEIERMVKES